MKRLPYARKQEILDMLKQNDFININQLSEKFNVSYMTIHRDLKELEDEGMVFRIYGGAVVNDTAKTAADTKNIADNPQQVLPQISTDLTLEERFASSQDAKRAIAREAAKFVRDGEIIGIDASSTALLMCPLLHDKNITVITNAINVALQFSDSESVNVIMVGSFLRKASLSLGGVKENVVLQHINIDKCFFSSSKVSFQKGMTELHFEESESKREMMQRAEQLFALADHTKLDGAAPFVDCNYRQISTLITDQYDGWKEEQIKCLRDFENSGVRVIRA